MWSSKVQLELGELLGEGSQGRVFKALRRDRVTNLTQIVAAKILHSRNAVEIWKREFESLSRVRSPYCVQVLSFERVRGRPALILEYVDGVSLAELARTPVLTDRDIDEIAAQIAIGLQDLSEQQVFHGDLNPHNVLVDKDGQIRLLDFGLANFGGSETRLTPAFAAQARLMGEPAGFESDMVSLNKLVDFLRGCEEGTDKRWPGAMTHPEHRRILGEKVRLRQQCQRAIQDLRTRTVTSGVRESRRNHMLTLLFFLLIASSTGAQRISFGDQGVLRVRTRLWHHLTFDGRPIGYAPVDIPVHDRSRHRIEWHSPKGRGFLDLRLAPGELRLLTDRDLTH